MDYPFFYTGAYCCYYGRDDITNQYMVLICLRGKVFAGKSEGYGVPGGYISAEKNEQPRDGAIRELGEELPFPDGTPVITTVTPDRLLLLESDINYRWGEYGPGYAGCVNHGYKCELTATEMKILKDHIAKMNTDPAYKAAVHAACHDEVESMKLVAPDELLNQIESGKISFAYKHEMESMIVVAKDLRTTPEHHSHDRTNRT